MAKLVRDDAREQATEQRDAPAGEQPVVATPEQSVFDQVAALEAKVAELEAKEARRREQVNARSREWRQKNLDKAREQTRERVRASRVRKRQADS